MDITKYEKIFAQESGKYLKELEDLLMQVEKDLSNLALWAEIHGKIHSIKGMARALSLNKISDLCHLMEDWSLTFQKGTINSSPDAVQALFDSSDFLRYLVSKKGSIDTFEDQELYSSLISKFEKNPSELTKTGSATQTDQTTNLYKTSALTIDHVKIKYSFIEELLGLTQEIQLLAKNFPTFSDNQMTSGLKNWIDHYATLMKVLYFKLTQLRLMNVGDFADLFLKSIRNIAKESNKSVNIEIIGSEIQADITLLERLREPMIHIFRNCIAHGIEPAEERTNIGKPANGKITIETKSEKENLFIKIRDDGRGINKSSIIQYLKEKQSMDDEDIGRMSEEELYNTILSPEFSSSAKTTELSGRGIGMNVVAQSIDYLGGSLSISSEIGKGTEFTIKLPLSLSIIYAIVFSIGKYNLAVPTLYVESISNIDASSDEDITSYYDIKKYIGATDNEKSPFNVLNLKYFNSQSAIIGNKPNLRFLVDNIIGNRPLMVLPTGELLSSIKLFSGIGIMENGDIALLLDIENLPPQKH
ncbi:MAG: ATP-binding protein [Pseudomonadota bacterium]